jgi:anion-transporting  ArsA/GET3 family ATPase
MPADGDPLRALLSRQLHFVTGKGGVGKSVVACALASAFVQAGHRTLLVQVNAPDRHARLLGIAPVGDEVQPAKRDLFVVNMTPAAALKEYALLVLKFEALYRTVFENRVTKAFLRFVPSMAELTMMGKVWFHAEEEDDGRRTWDRIVIDAPSTGHAMKLLSVSRTVRDASRFGPMFEKTKLMADVVGDPERTALHVVTIPEEMPVNETLDLIAQVKLTRDAPLGALVINNLLEPLFDDETSRALDAAAKGAVDPEAQALVTAGQRRRVRETIEREESARLRDAGLGMPIVRLPHLLVDDFGPAEVERFARMFREGV